jgi:hypothetical protein
MRRSWHSRHVHWHLQHQVQGDGNDWQPFKISGESRDGQRPGSGHAAVQAMGWCQMGTMAVMTMEIVTASTAVLSCSQ